MGGEGEDVDGQGGGASAEADGTDAEAIDVVIQLLLKGGQVGALVDGADGAQQGFLAEVGGALHRATNADTDDGRRTGVGTGVRDGIYYELLDAGHTVAGHEHFQVALVFAAEAFGRDNDVEGVAGHHLIVDDGGRVVFRIHAVDRVANDRLAEVALLVALADALVDGVLDEAAGDADVLAPGDEDDGHAGVLTDGDALLAGDAGVVDEGGEHLATQR